MNVRFSSSVYPLVAMVSTKFCHFVLVDPIVDWPS